MINIIFIKNNNWNLFKILLKIGIYIIDGKIIIVIILMKIMIKLNLINNIMILEKILLIG